MRLLFKDKGYNLISTEYKGNKSPLIFEKDGYIYCNTYNGFIKTNNPKKWGVNNPYSIENLKRYLKGEDATCIVLSTEYNYNSIRLRCSCGEEYTLSWHNLLVSKQYVCPSCGRKRSALNHRIDDKYLPLLGKYGLTLCEEYKGCKVHHWAKTKEGYITKVQLYSLSKGTDLYDFVFDVANPNSLNNIKLWLELNGKGLQLQSEKYIGAKERYIFKCSCGNKFESSWQYIYSNCITRCPKCSHKISGLELKTREWLEEHEVDYIPEKIFPDCVYKLPLRFDFYLPKLNKIIEVDGQQHYYPHRFGIKDEQGAMKVFNLGKKKDEIKNKYCKSHGIPLIRIPYTAFKSDKYKDILKTFTVEV